MRLPRDIWVFIGNQANSFSTKWANEDSDTLVVSMRTLVLLIASMLKAEYLEEKSKSIG